jgi:uncharacterized damage-inducible protein DinB
MNTAEQFSHWEAVRRDLNRALDLLTDDQLGFVPAQGLWSLGKVARHIAEAEEGWFRFGVTRELPAWPRFSDEDYPSISSIQDLLAQVHERTAAFLATVGPEQLHRTVETPWDEKIPLHDIVWHVL